uniref:hypothetical protein n=1 Tax=uncultured Mucilaginibacter sp. TaxID=797541 RepID=UPI0025ED1D06
ANDSTSIAQSSENDESYGWKNYAENLEMCNVTGNHITMMKSPNVITIANKINEKIATKIALNYID